MSDLVSRADAIGAVHEYYQKRFTENSKWDADAKMLVLEDKTIAKDNMEICNIIKALPSAELPKGYLISRADAIRWVKTECNPYGKPTLDYDSGLKVIEHLKKMPSELPSTEAEWIPCSNGLPSESGNYLITVADLRLGHNGEHTVTMADFYAKAKKWNSIVDVYAWMPLPKPYREDGE